MNEKIETLLEQIKQLEKQLSQEVQRKEVQFLYEVRQRKVQFSAEAQARHKRLAKRVHHYVLGSRFLVILTAPLLWLFLPPIALLDLGAFAYQAVCFPIYGIPKVRRSDYVVMDRRRLGYLNVIEKLNCVYCSYANGFLAYMGEIAARTEQHWCPIKHALRLKSVHSRYKGFLEYGDAEGYREHLEKLRRSYEDIEAAEAEDDAAESPLKS